MSEAPQPASPATSLPAALKLGIRQALGRLIYLLLSLRGRSWPTRHGNVTLIVAPHPDDCTLGCGGLIRRRVAAAEDVRIVYLTDGAASHPGHPSLTPAELVVQRAEEIRLARKILGLNSVPGFLGAPDGQLPQLAPAARQRVVRALTDIIDAVRPAEIFVTARHDGSTEHQAAWEIARDALAGSSHTRARLYEYVVWARWSPRLRLRSLFWPGTVHELRLSSPELDTKLRAISTFRSQLLPTPPWTQSVLPTGFIRMFTEPREYFWTRRTR